MDTVERARRYLAAMEPSISGSNGHNAAFSAAVAMVKGFALSEETALQLLREGFNPRCAPPWSERELLHKVRQAARASSESGYLIGNQRQRTAPAGSPAPVHQLEAAVEPERENKRHAFDAGALGRMMVRGFSPGYAWFAERSAVDPRRCTPMEFLDRIFKPGEKTLVFTRYFSQGDYGHVAGSPGTTWRLGDRPGVAPQRVNAIPQSAPDGAWYLPCPMDGQWHPSGSSDQRGNPILSRRSGASVTAYRHMLLESDDAPEDEWMALLATLPLPITAMYTSGGRSVHALVRIDAKSKSEFDAFRDRVVPFLSRLGADPAAISGVRLTRIPGVMREGSKNKEGRYQKFQEPRLQRLLYLNPKAECVAIKTLPRLRSVKADQDIEY